ncbi:O-methyltransferase [Podospora appendiculata]|uniref:O-methyltransferase n=1 Tax=Podospora appendiculata TaxID=314037 RepID=A0AAE0XCW3_9PEZI|nr:O-methyltransferase [Podospora appendiculata]
MAREGQAELQLATEQLNAAVARFNNEPAADEAVDQGQRRDIIEAAKRIIESVEGPAEQWVESAGSLAVIAANRLFWEWNVFESIPLDGSSISYADLATKVDAELALLTRIGGLLVSSGVLKQIGPDHIAHTPRSKIFVEENPAGAVYMLNWDNGLQMYAQLPKYFEQYGRKEPEAMTHIPLTFSHGHPEIGYYEMIARDPAVTRRFLQGMAGIEARTPVVGIYDFSWVVSLVQHEHHELSVEAHMQRPLFVDIGGGPGKAIKLILAEYPALPAERFYLQDREGVIKANQALNDPALRGVQYMAIDFHVAQPLKGALIYFFRRVLHNYADPVTVNILRHVAEAMAPDSKLLLQEDIAENPPNRESAWLDLLMLGFGGKQRTLDNWERVLGAAGLEIASIASGKGPWKSLRVIECVKKTVV